MKIIGKHKLEKQINEKKEAVECVVKEISKCETQVQVLYQQIGELVLKKGVKVADGEINQLTDRVKDYLSRQEELARQKEELDQELYKLREKMRNMDGKVSCPKCRKIYELNKELLFCPKCGTDLRNG